MNDLQKIYSIISKEGIELISHIGISGCKILRPYLLERAGLGAGSTVFMLAVPYVSRFLKEEKRNICRYAVSRDYHLYFKELEQRLLPCLSESFPQNTFKIFTDHSPIDEVNAAAAAGLGIIGDNGLLITEKYSSFVFLGEIITDICFPYTTHEISQCSHCGACTLVCPSRLSKSDCLSALTQKKGSLSAEETALLSEHPLIWGCDICQEACPHTKRAFEDGTVYSNIKFFNESLTPYLNTEIISSMSDNDFENRAFSWRGRETILRNAKIKELTKGDDIHK